MDILLVRGLRQIRVEGGRDLRELATDAIRGDRPAAHGLGGNPFYVLRADENFGLVLFFPSEVEDAD